MQNYFIIVFCCIFFYNPKFLYPQSDSAKTIIKDFVFDIPDKTYFTIKNPSDSVSVISFNLNHNFFFSTNELIDEIYRLSGYNKDSLFYIAWKFICDYSYSNPPISDTKWTIGLLLNLNSVGFGLCGNQAIILTRIWSILGYNSRIWGIGGHIIPEIYFNGKWLMLDPTYKVFYTNAYGQIASVKELEKNPNLITKPINIQKNNSLYKLRHSKEFAKLYKTSKDNKIIFEGPFTETNTNYSLTLPPHAVFEFPRIYYTTMKNINGSQIPFYANSRLKIPPNQTGTITCPFLLLDISGSGKIIINNIKYDIKDSALKKLIAEKSYLIQKIEITEQVDTIYLFFLINPFFSTLKNKNHLILKGSNISTLQIQYNIINDSSSIREKLLTQYFFYDNPRIDFLEKHLNSKQNINTEDKIKTKKGLIKILQLYYLSDTNYNSQNTQLQFEKINRILTTVSKNNSLKKIFYLLNNSPRKYLFFDLYNAPEEVIYNYLTTLKL